MPKPIRSEADLFYALWKLENYSPDYQLYETPAANALIKAQAIKYGNVCIGSFLRAFADLKKSGQIKQIRQPAPPAAPELTADIYNRLSTSETRRRYQQDPNFKQQVDALMEKGAI